MVEIAQSPVWVGADPGGAGAIVVEGGDITTMCVSCADEAVDLVTVRPSGVGVDAPLWWSSGPSAGREADRWIRNTYRKKIRSGTVQTPNSLRGAALVQAAMFVQRRLREKYPKVPVTKAHPKAVAIALGGRNSPAVLALQSQAVADEHQRDAYLAAAAAREGFSGRWKRDLSLNRSQSEQDPKSFWLAPIYYFWR
jgi:predicted nuclease with RNAse H fold